MIPVECGKKIMLPTMIYSLVNQQLQIRLWMKFTPDPYGQQHAKKIVETIPMPFHWHWCAFMTKRTQIYMDH